jgi:hypothetical protein
MRYFQGKDFKGDVLTAAIEVDINTPADRAAADEYGKLLGTTETREITAAAYAKSTKRADEKPRGRAGK